MPGIVLREPVTLGEGGAMIVVRWLGERDPLRTCSRPREKRRQNHASRAAIRLRVASALLCCCLDELLILARGHGGAVGPLCMLRVEERMHGHARVAKHQPRGRLLQRGHSRLSFDATLKGLLMRGSLELREKERSAQTHGCIRVSYVLSGTYLSFTSMQKVEMKCR